MGIKTRVKRVLNYIISIRKKHVNANIVSLNHSELLNGRVALITGGTSGIGKSIAIAFLNAGAEVVITGRNKDRVQRIVTEIGQDIFKGRIHGIDMDNTDIKSFPKKISEIDAIIMNKTIDILVNNAGIMKGQFRTCTEEEYDIVLDTNLKGSYFLCQTFADYLISRKKNGNILIITSASGIRPATSPYMLSKWGLTGLTKGLARMLAPYGIIVNGIAPGPTSTSMQKKSSHDDISWPNNLLGRMAIPEEISNMAVILASNMGNTIIGDIIYMSGGGGIITNEDVSYSY